MQNFLVNDDGTINIHYDRLNPTEVMELIKLLDGNVRFLSKNCNPIDVFLKSARLNRITREISFQFDWDGDVYRVSLDNPELPKPKVHLTPTEFETYQNTFFAMIKN